MAYKSLAAHNAACNPAFYAFQDCEKEHPVGRAFGYCTDLLKNVERCIKEQRKIQRERNYKLSQERSEKLRKMLAQEREEKES
ncbi:hypothetical protein KM043_004870 [Ampulex compressa]|nr:hypothetical protein KM043_004870 [Ampulex compressa]